MNQVKATAGSQSYQVNLSLSCNTGFKADQCRKNQEAKPYVNYCANRYYKQQRKCFENKSLKTESFNEAKHIQVHSEQQFYSSHGFIQQQNKIGQKSITTNQNFGSSNTSQTSLGFAGDTSDVKKYKQLPKPSITLLSSIKVA